MMKLRMGIALVVIACGLGPALSASVDQGKLDTGSFSWRLEAANKSEVQHELARFYIRLHEAKSLPTRTVSIRKGENATDVLIRSGAWPSWLKNW